MKLGTIIKSVQIEIKQDRLVVQSTVPLKTLSSAALNGGLREADVVLNIQVPEDCGKREDDEVHSHPETFLGREAMRLGFSPERVIGLITAADVHNAEITNEDFNGVSLTTIVTAGTHFSATAGDEITSHPNLSQTRTHGTINTIILIDGNLTDSCLAQALTTATEAKTVALRELDIRSHFSTALASGTVTDSTVIACTQRGTTRRYAGTATRLGEGIGRSVKNAVKGAIFKQDKLRANRSLVERLEERNISVETLAHIFSNIYSSIDGRPHDMSLIKERLEEALSDQHIGSLVIASLRFDEDAEIGLLPETSNNLSFNTPVVSKALESAAISCLSGERHTIRPPTKANPAFPEGTGPSTQSVLLTIMTHIHSDIRWKQTEHRRLLSEST